MPKVRPDCLTGSQLHMWRRDRNLSQEALAKALGVHRNTIVNWERNKAHIPWDVTDKLATLAYTLMPKPVVEAPQWVNVQTAPHLYKPKLRGYKDLNTPNSDHPRNVLGDDHPLYDRREQRWPFSVLASEVYLTALARKRGE